jgi:hypothetical protein
MPNAAFVPVYAVIPMAGFMVIDAGTASSSPFQRTTKIVHDHDGIRVHDPLESAFTMRWKPRTPCAGICSMENLALPWAGI